MIGPQRRKGWLLALVAGSMMLSMQGMAQQPWSVGMRGGYGFLWPHHKDLWVLVERHVAAIELFAEKQVSGDRPWHHYYKGPSYGGELLLVDFKDPDRIGTAVRILPYLYLPITGSDHDSFGIRMGWGLGYISKAYNRVENTQQIAIGSRLNMAILLNAEYHRTVGRNLFTAGLGIDHWSNGSFKQPNRGINYLALHLGVARYLGKREPLVYQPDTSFTSWQRSQSVILGFGMNESTRPHSGQHSVYCISAQVQWRVSRKSMLSVGADVFNKGTLDVVDDRSRIGYTQFGMHGGYALVLGPSEIFLHVGAYLYSPVPEETSVFHRVGYRYRAGKHLLLNLSLKSHYAVADHVEIGIGYQWH